MSHGTGLAKGALPAFILGSLAGAAAALLRTPQTGGSRRSRIVERIRAGLLRGQAAITRAEEPPVAGPTDGASTEIEPTRDSL